MIAPSFQKKLLTVDDLRRNIPGADLGYWSITTMHGRNKKKYLIVKDHKGYTLAMVRPLAVLARTGTAAAIIEQFNKRMATDEVLA